MEKLIQIQTLILSYNHQSLAGHAKGMVYMYGISPTTFSFLFFSTYNTLSILVFYMKMHFFLYQSSFPSFLNALVFDKTNVKVSSTGDTF